MLLGGQPGFDYCLILKEETAALKKNGGIGQIALPAMANRLVMARVLL
jgi:hypothetical protein